MDDAVTARRMVNRRTALAMTAGGVAGGLVASSGYDAVAAAAAVSGTLPVRQIEVAVGGARRTDE